MLTDIGRGIFHIAGGREEDDNIEDIVVKEKEQIDMIYSFHHYNYWMKGGVETGLVHRAKIFRDLGLDAKFVFATTFPEHNIWDEMQALGFIGSEVLWMYSFFTDSMPSPVTYTLEQLEKTFSGENYTFLREGNIAKFQFPDLNVYYIVYMTDEENNFVHRVVMISNGNLVRKDYYTCHRIYSEYYVPTEGQARLYLRRFFNEDGSAAYEELIDSNMVIYKFPDRMLYSREELVEYMMRCLQLTERDVVLIDGEWGIIDRAAFLQNSFPAKTGFVVHLNHSRYHDKQHILWNEVFEYAFSHPDKINFFITNTEMQSRLLREQLQYYKGIDARVETIPVASIDRIRVPDKKRKKHSLITAGRFQADKRTDWLIEAAVMAKKELLDLTLDIYGGGEEENQLRELIEKLDCSSYVHLCGFRKLDEIYQNYDAYVSASYGETFGITLLEAVGSGLPIVGFDRPYGIQNFVDEGENGFRITDMSAKGLADGIIRLFKDADLEAFRRHSYRKAEAYLETEVGKKWKEILS